MNLIDDDKFDFLYKQPLPSFSGDDIPFFRSRDDNLSLFYLALAQIHISSEFLHGYPQTFEPILKISCNFSNQSLHGRNVYNFEFGIINQP